MPRLTSGGLDQSSLGKIMTVKWGVKLWWTFGCLVEKDWLSFGGSLVARFDAGKWF